MSLALFVVPQLLVRFLLGQPVWTKDIRYLVYGSAIPFLWYLLVPREMNDLREINFLQHMIGGGVAVGFISIYIINSLSLKFDFLQNFFFKIIFVYALVSSFGVANELLEFALDYTGVGIFSADRYDVWFDLTANTTGAFLVFFIHFILAKVFRKN